MQDVMDFQFMLHMQYGHLVAYGQNELHSHGFVSEDSLCPLAVERCLLFFVCGQTFITGTACFSDCLIPNTTRWTGPEFWWCRGDRQENTEQTTGQKMNRQNKQTKR